MRRTPSIVSDPSVFTLGSARGQNGSHNAAEEEIAFRSGGVLTLGVETELQLIDPDTCNLAARAPEILEAAAHIEGVKPEFYLSTVEVNSDKCTNVQEVEKDLGGTFTRLDAVAEQMGIQLSTTGSHPFAKYSDCVISSTERYKEMTERNQWMTRRMTVYGLHVHIGMASGEDCIRYNNFFMHFLPHLLALSGSSPFWQGIDTGLSSCRPTTYEALPTAGLPYHVQNWRDFVHTYAMLKQCGSIRSLRDLWWDMRPSPGFGTLEIRVCDGTATLYETLAIVAYIHCLAHWFKENGDWLESVNYPPYWLARENKWRAIRYGCDAELVMNSDGQISLLREEVEKWVTKLLPYAEKLGYQKYINDLLTLMNNGTSAERQRRVFKRTGSLEEVVRHTTAEHRLRRPIWDSVEDEWVDYAPLPLPARASVKKG